MRTVACKANSSDANNEKRQPLKKHVTPNTPKDTAHAASRLGQHAPRKKISPICVNIGVSARTTMKVSTYGKAPLPDLH